MPAYYMNDGAFHLPDVGFVDRTVHVFEAPLPDDQELGLIVCRTKIPAGKSLRDLVAAHVKNEGARLHGYTVIDQRDTQVSGAPAIDVRSRFRHEGEVVYQRQAHVAAYGTWLLFAMSAPLATRDACDEHVDSILASLRLRDAG